MYRLVRLTAVGMVAAVALVTFAALGAGQEPGDDRRVLVTAAEGAVTPVLADHLRDALAAATDGGHTALVVRIDTPGGLVTSMRDITKDFLNARVPVVVWVAPAGAGAASAGYIITSAAHVAAMAPGTNIGAATPVSLEGAEVGDKVVNDAVSYARAIAETRGRNQDFAEEATRDGRSVTAETALEIDVVDVLAVDESELLRAVDGTEVELTGGATATVQTAGATVERYEPSLMRRVLQWLADPNLAFIFLSIAPLAILYEIANPGMGAGGILGAILIVLALFALSVLPVNGAGVALLVLAIALFIGEAFVPGLGVMAGGGAVSLLLAGLFLFQRPTGVGVDLVVLIPTVVVAAIAAVGLAVVARRTWSRRPETSPGALEGARGTVRHVDDTDTMQVFVEGALWRARTTDAQLQEGDRVRVVRRDGLVLDVEPIDTPDRTPTDS